MKDLKELAKYYYTEENYNCSEAIIHAANERYDLKISEDDMKMFGGFGSGMYAGIVCGALAAGVAVLSKMVVVSKAREEGATVRPAISNLVRTFRKNLDGISCAELRPKYYTPEESCLKTVLLAAEALELSIEQSGKGSMC